MPQDGELICIAALAGPIAVREAYKMEDESVDDFIRQFKLFVDKDADEEGVGTGIVHLSYTEKGSRCMQNWDFRACEDRCDDSCLF